MPGDEEPREAQATPLRRQPHELVDGCRHLADRSTDYADGAEQHLYDLVARQADLSSLSAGLEQDATSRPEFYHASRSRANAFRALDLPRDARVLEIGAGCGSITRYLAEQCALVDALEPELHRARVARSRTRDLNNTEVFVGSIADVAIEPTYDVVVMCGVLEYIAGGSADTTRYVEVLEASRQLLRPGGVVICAIENQMGAKYLAGAREDHTARIFDGLEGYPQGTRARTFTRPVLEGMFEAAGLRPHVLHAFPDYKATRVVFDDALLAHPVHQRLACKLPVFPSVDWWEAGSWQIGDERRIWETLVEAGRGSESANSFVVIGAAPSGSPASTAVWPADRRATYFNVDGRATQFARRSHVVEVGGTLEFARDLLLDGGTSSRIDELEIRAIDERLVVGDDMVDVIAGADTARADRLLRAWLQQVRELFAQCVSSGSALPIDFAPHNIVVTGDDTLHAIDQEWWWHGSASVEQVVAFGAIEAARQLALRSPKGEVDDRTVGEFALELALRSGAALEFGDLLAGTKLIAAVHARVGAMGVDSLAEREASIEETYGTMLSQRVDDVRATQFLVVAGMEDALAAAEAEVRAVVDAAADLREHYERLQAHAADARGHYDALVADRDAVVARLRETERELSDARAQLRSATSSRRLRILEALRGTRRSS